MYMDKILEFHPSDLEVTVEAGVEWTYLNSQLKAENLFFPVDPFIGAKIGGMIATGCSGTNAARYGSIKDGWVLSLTVVLADGSIIKTKSGTKKNSSGYDINRLFIGSEGTLGIITQATLKLANLAKFQRVVICAFETIDVSYYSFVSQEGVFLQGLQFCLTTILGRS
jgi:D-lactate dehydrogenase (cytochrome)